MSRRTEIAFLDIRGGKFTYGQRIELAGIFSASGLSDTELYDRTMRCLYPDRKVRYTGKWMTHFEQIVHGLEFWAQREQTMLNYQPTGEELAAGINELGKKLGPMATVMTLAEKFGKDPDEILRWEYGKVFGLLYADLENFKFQRRLMRVREGRAQQKRLSRR